MNIDKKQIQLIHIAKTQLNIDDETYRDMLQTMFNVSSSKELTYRQASNLIDVLKSKGFKLKKHKTPIKRGDKVIKLATTFQRELIEVLKANVVWRVDNGYEAWLLKRMKIKKVITSAEAQKAIEGLKGMLGITSAIIEMQSLPFPLKNEKNINGWFFDTENKRLVCIDNSNEGVVTCLQK